MTLPSMPEGALTLLLSPIGLALIGGIVVSMYLPIFKLGQVV